MMSDKMKITLSALNGYESIIGRGTTAGEVAESGGSRSSLATAVKNGWVNTYPKEVHASERRAPAYYLTSEGETALKAQQ